MNSQLVHEPVVTPAIEETIIGVREAHEKLSNLIACSPVWYSAGNLRWRQVCQAAGIQFLVVRRADDSDHFMEEHIHPESLEVVTVLRGELELNERTYGAGQSAAIEPSQPHRGRAISNDFLAVAICYPPEEAYTNAANRQE